MRLSIAASSVLLAACATLAGGGRDSVEFTVPVTTDEALRIGVAQLQLHGYQIGTNERNMLVTIPRAVPEGARGGAAGAADRQWIVRVEASPVEFTGDTRIRVTGYLIPPGAPAAVADTAVATPVTADDRELFGELQSVGRWIVDAARRQRSGG